MVWSEALSAIVSGVIIGMGTYYRGRVSGKRKHFHDLHDCERRCAQLQDRVSAFETEMVAIRHLMPGGEWYEKLRDLVEKRQ